MEVVGEDVGKGAALVATSHAALAGEVARRLSTAGYQPLLVFDRDQLMGVARRQPDLEVVVVDSLLLHDADDDFLDDLREEFSSPVIVLHPGSLASDGTIESLLASLGPATSTARTSSSWQGLELVQRTHEAYLDGASLYFTPTEYRILEALISAAGALVRREDLERAVWDTPSLDDGERLATHIRRIRQKIEADRANPAFLLTVRGLGYRLADRSDTGRSSDARAVERRDFVG
jgi:DNA-binding response OmpR family regulator